jgi:hypothetical protein
VKLWAAGFGGGALYEEDVQSSAAIAGDAKTRAEWIAAVKSMASTHWWSNGRKAVSLLNMAVAWDDRLEALAISQMRQKANHVNVHTGRRHADAPSIVVWELTNEQWWMRHMTGGQWQSLPAYFRATLIAKWNDFLTKKYGTEANLTKAWGFLFPGEELAGGTVMLAPMERAMKAVELNDTNPHALEAFRMIDFNERVLAEDAVGHNGLLYVPSDMPVWVTELERE